MKYAVKVRETLTRIVIVEAENYLEAEDKTSEAYYNDKFELNADNSAVYLELENDSDIYVEIFGGELFQKMEATI